MLPALEPGPGPKLWNNAVGQPVVLTDTTTSILNGAPVKDAVKTAHEKIVGTRNKLNGA